MLIDLSITLSAEVARSPRVQQLEGLFDVAPADRSLRSWRHRFSLPEKWQIGVIVGPSGAGKSTLARRAFGDAVAGEFAWPADRSILDGFPIQWASWISLACSLPSVSVLRRHGCAHLPISPRASNSG